MQSTNENFKKLIELSMDFIREGTAEAEKMSNDFPAAMKLLSTKQARIELRVSFDPVPNVTCALIRQDDGEVIGHLFAHQARTATVN
jgi:hypothetical protein